MYIRMPRESLRGQGSNNALEVEGFRVQGSFWVKGRGVLTLPWLLSPHSNQRTFT